MQNPRYVDTSRCIACGLCAEKCPKKVPNAYDGGLAPRKAAYVKYAQAVPLKYAIDAAHCIYLTKGKCRACEKICPRQAINFKDQKQIHHLHVGAVVLAEGTKTFDPGVHDTYGYTKHPNIMTSLEFERVLSSSGPYGGHLVRPSDRKEPKKIAWFQCIGSRDEHPGANAYCSSVCCTYAVKEAMLAKEHSKGAVDTAIFYIDIRTNGKDFERYYNRAKDEMGVRFIKSRVTNVTPVNGTGRHLIRYVDASGKRVEEEFDIVVLSVGLAMTKEGVELARKLGVDTDPYGFARVSSFQPVQSSTPGIYVCGACQAPKDIPSSVIDSSAVAGVTASRLAKTRWSLTRTKSVPEERKVRGEATRIGVFVCCCGSNIAGIVDVDAVVEFAKGLPGVSYAEKNLFSCSQDTQEKLAQAVKQHRLNRVVVAACTPKTHEPLFQETMRNAGLNKYLFEMANIRNQCSWVHKDDPVRATLKAKDLVRMAVAKAGLLEPLSEPGLQIEQKALIIGGGIAGMTAAKTLAGQGFRTYLVEKSSRLGGNARSIHETWRGEKVPEFVASLAEEIQSNENIEIFFNAGVKHVEGFVGNFRTTVQMEKESRNLIHGVTIIATGASELKPDLYLYGEDPRVVTGLELQERFLRKDPSLGQIRSATFIQCVGSRIPERPYCSKICCTQSLKSALKLKELNPEMAVSILYRDMRPYGLRELLYREARSRGIVFVRYDSEKPLEVALDGGNLQAKFTDCVLRRSMVIQPELLVLAAAVTPEQENPLAHFYKVPQNDDGFFMEAHAKLRPVDFATEGVFVCGLAHSPKPIDESITQAQAAAGRAATLLSAKTMTVSGTVAEVDPAYCSRCGVCVSICPYGAPMMAEKSGKAEIQPTLCKGCGLCAASCRSGAIHLKGFDTPQIMAMIEASV